MVYSISVYFIKFSDLKKYLSFWEDILSKSLNCFRYTRTRSIYKKFCVATTILKFLTSWYISTAYVKDIYLKNDWFRILVITVKVLLYASTSEYTDEFLKHFYQFKLLSLLQFIVCVIILWQNMMHNVSLLMMLLKKWVA